MRNKEKINTDLHVEIVQSIANKELTEGATKILSNVAEQMLTYYSKFCAKNDLKMYKDVMLSACKTHYFNYNPNKSDKCLDYFKTIMMISFSQSSNWYNFKFKEPDRLSKKELAKAVDKINWIKVQSDDQLECDQLYAIKQELIKYDKKETIDILLAVLEAQNLPESIQGENLKMLNFDHL